MRPRTLQNASEQMTTGGDDNHQTHERTRQERVLSEFIDTFYLSKDNATRKAMLDGEPGPSGDARHDALMGAVAEYLSRQNGLGPGPAWAFAPKRYLPQPWHVTEIKTPGMIEFLSWVSPAEFKSRNIFTDERPLRRASQVARSR